MQFAHNDTVMIKVTNLLTGQSNVQNSEVTSQESEKFPLVTDRASVYPNVTERFYLFFHNTGFISSCQLEILFNPYWISLEARTGDQGRVRWVMICYKRAWPDLHWRYLRDKFRMLKRCSLIFHLLVLTLV